MSEPVTILMPVGPNYNSEWLKESIDSVLEQTYPIKELLIVDDGANITNIKIREVELDINLDYSSPASRVYGLKNIFTGVLRFFPFGWKTEVVTFYKLPVNLGFTAAFNLGMALAANDLVVYLAADDKLLPEAIEKAVDTWKKNNKKDAWYSFTYELSNGGKSSIPINAAMTTKHFFLDMCGGFPPAAFVGPDAALLSCLIAHAPDRIIKVEEGTPLYWIREHDQQETKLHTWKYVDEMNSIRNKLTKDFKLNE